MIKPLRYTDLKCTYTKQQSLEIYETKPDGAKRRNRQTHNYSWRL